VFRNGPVFRADAARSWARAVAVRGGRIAAVGGDEMVVDLVGPDTRVVDLDGRLLCPGFQDAHVHPVTGGRILLECNLTEVATWPEARRIVADYAAAHPDLPFIWGGGWQFAWFSGGLPTREELDELIPDRPAYLRVADGHAGWANTRALEAAGIHPGTPDPPDGRIERTPDGRIQGTLQEEGGMRLVERLRVEADTDLDRALRRGQQYLIERGITAWQDAAVTPALHRTYLRMAGSGELIATVRGALWWEPGAGPAEQLARMEEMRAESVPGYLPGSVKLMLDGVVENFTARVLTPYLRADGASTGTTGLDYFEPQSLPPIVTEIVRRGFQPHFHALGDAAVRAALDAVAAARSALGHTDVRPHVAHLQIVDPADIPRFRALGVAANAQPLWACNEEAMTDLTLPFLEPRVAANQYPFRSLLDAGATMAMGSDWSVSTPDVMQQVHVAVTRTVPWDRRPEPFQPDQGVSVADALAAFTAGSSFVNFLDAERGSITAGGAADLVVLGGNPFESDDIAAIGVDLTVIGGDVVFER
jgi:predicted amidohydrolase YtcJ